MTDPKPKQDVLYARVTPEVKVRFAEAVARLAGPWTCSDVLRELAVAFIEGRVSVQPPSDKKENLFQ